MAKSDSKKVKAKSEKKSTQRKENKKQQQEAKVLAELELRDTELDGVTGGATLPTRANTTNTTNPTNPTATKNLGTGDLNVGPEPHLKDALNLGLY